MNKKVLMEDLYPIIKEKLEVGGTVRFTVSGVSMQPMLYNLRDSVTLKSPKLPLKKYDLPLYRLDDGKFILHRVIKVKRDGGYICRGDNLWTNEEIEDRNIIGVVESFTRNGKEYNVATSKGYFLYTRTWRFFHHFKKFYKYVKPILKKSK